MTNPQICFAFFCAFAISGVYHGTGQHANVINPPTEIPIGLKVCFLDLPPATHAFNIY
jgi:hypothetical protein